MSDQEELEIICKNLKIKSSNVASEFEGGRLINLALTGLTELPPGIFDKLNSLETLGLYSNQLTELPPRLFNDLTSLETLNLRNNQLTELPQGIFDKLKVFTKLYLGNNQLTETPQGLFERLSSLKELDLTGNQINIPIGINNIKYIGDDIAKLYTQYYREKAFLFQQILKIISQVKVDIPMSLLRLSELVTMEKIQTEKTLKTILDQHPDLGEYLPMEQVFIKKTEVKEELFTEYTFTDSLQKCKNCGDSQSVLIRSCTNCGESLPYCNICKRGFAEKDQTTNCPECNNPFHRTHLIAQVQSNGSCPICRVSLTLSQVT